MRDSSLRSHHSLAAVSGVKRPRIAKPSASSAASGTSNSAEVRPSGCASASAPTGPSPSSRPRTISTRASSRDHARLSYGGGTASAGAVFSFGHNARNCGSRSAEIHSVDISDYRSARRAFERQARQASRSSADRTGLRRRSKSRATPSHRAIRRHFPPRAMLQTAPARRPQDRDGRDRQHPAAKSSDAPLPPGCGAPPAERRRDRHMAAPTTLRARAATAASGRAR